MRFSQASGCSARAVDRAAHRLRLFRVTSPEDDLEPGILGIREPRPHCPEVDPAQVDWALIPGLAFDRQCYRLGRGGGHYDRLLPLMRPDALCWGMGFSCQIVAGLPVEPHDVPLSGVATEDGIISPLSASLTETFPLPA